MLLLLVFLVYVFVFLFLTVLCLVVGKVEEKEGKLRIVRLE